MMIPSLPAEQVRVQQFFESCVFKSAISTVGGVSICLYTRKSCLVIKGTSAGVTSHPHGFVGDSKNMKAMLIGRNATFYYQVELTELRSQAEHLSVYSTHNE